MRGREKLELVQNRCYELLVVLHEICEKNNIRYWLDFGTLLGAHRHNGFIPWDDDIDVCIPMEDYKRLIPILNDYCKQEDNSHLLFFADTEFDYWYEYFGDASLLVNGTIPVKIDLFPAKIIENTETAIAYDESMTNVARTLIMGKAKNIDSILEEHRHYIPEPGDDVALKKKVFFDDYYAYMSRFKLDESIGKNRLITSSVHDALITGERPYFEVDKMTPFRKVKFKQREFYCPHDTPLYLEMLYGDDYMTPPPKDERVSHIGKIKKSKLPKQDVKDLIEKIYTTSIDLQSFDDVTEHKTDKIAKLKVFTGICLYLIGKLRLKSLYNYILYFILFHLPVTDKVHLEN